MNKAPTRTQLRILQAISIGMRDPEIAKREDIALATVRTHVCAALPRLGVHTRAHAVAECMRAGLIE